MTTTDRTGADTATFEAELRRLDRLEVADESAVERVARAMWEDVDGYTSGVPWEYAGSWKQAKYRRLAAAALRPLKPPPGTDSSGQASEHEVVVEVYDGIAIGMRCATCMERIPVRPERAAISVAEVDRLARDHAPGTDSSGQAVQRVLDLDRAELAGDYAASAGLYCLDCNPTGSAGDRLASPGDLAEALDAWAEHRGGVHRADAAAPQARCRCGLPQSSPLHGASGAAHAYEPAVAGPQRDHEEEGS